MNMISIAKPLIGAEEKKAVLDILDSGIIAQGSRVKAFEDKFAELFNSSFAIATSSGTTALQTALIAHEVGPGDEVITTSFSFIASTSSVLFVGADPVFVDIDPRTFTIDTTKIEEAITPKTKAIMPVHLYGLICDMDPIVAIAKKYNIIIIEDACQAHGATYKGRKAGSFGTGTFSLYPTKNITSGEGGMITTNSSEIDEICRMFRNHGMRRRYHHDRLGYNFRMTDIHAAIGLVQLSKLMEFNNSRIENANFLTNNLKGVTTPFIPNDQEHVFHQYTIRVPNGLRDSLREYLRKQGVNSEIYYPVPIHKQKFILNRLGTKNKLPETDKAADEVLSIPVHPGLAKGDLKKIVRATNQFMEEKT
jgi:dTDP-4-amino-4,6-dideoxygalactose transaminase